MNRFIQNERGRQVSTGGLMRLLGVKDTALKWPDAGVPRQQVQGIWVWVEPKNPAERIHKPNGLVRALAQCPVCKAIVSVGRLEQHGKKHPAAVDEGVPPELMHPASVWNGQDHGK